MKTKNVVSGAMIVAAGVSASTGGASAAKVDPQGTGPGITESGLSFDMVKLDDDVLLLGGLSQGSGAFGVHGETDGFLGDGEELYLAQTVYGGGGNDGLSAKGQLRIPGAVPLVVIDPNTNRSMTVLYNKSARTY
ncbi:MAG: hypothetical protein LJE68_04610, partial [Rhodobacter sp.]|nr:hypothetical protein [Rhodobacter sp.]